MDIFRERLREALEAAKSNHGWTQEDVAEKLGVSRRRLNNWINTSRQPTLETFAHLCQLLDINPGYLLGLTDHRTLTSENQDFQRLERKIDALVEGKH